MRHLSLVKAQVNLFAHRTARNQTPLWGFAMKVPIHQQLHYD